MIGDVEESDLPARCGDLFNDSFFFAARGPQRLDVDRRDFGEISAATNLEHSGASQRFAGDAVT